MKHNSDENRHERKVQELLHTVAKHLAPYRELLLAFSGGLDSMVLLDILTKLRDANNILDNTGKNLLMIRAVHINHGWSRHANDWVTYCSQQCQQRNVNFSIKRVFFNKKSSSIEEEARNVRYQTFSSILTKNETLLTAHHQDDQTETLLLALKRGSGPAGLSAIAIDTAFDGHRLVRPLLECSRAELEIYARACKLSWIEDDSNQDLRFDRNFLRLQILPVLKHRWPRFSSNAARSAQLCAEQEKLLDELLAKTLKEVIQSDGSLLLTTLKSMSDIRRAAILRRWLASCGVRMPSRRQLACLWTDIGLSRQDSIAQMQIDGRQLRRFQNRLYILPKFQACLSSLILSWDKQDEEFILPEKLGIIYRQLMDTDNVVKKKFSPLRRSYANVFGESKKKHSDTTSSVIQILANRIKEVDTIFSSKNSDKVIVHEVIVRAPLLNEQVSVRFGPVRGLLYIDGRHHGRKLKKIWQELNIPPWKRNNIPLIFYDDKLITALGVFITLEGLPQKSKFQWYIWWVNNYFTYSLMGHEKTKNRE